MRNIAEFAIIGRIGSIKEVGTTTRVAIASNYSHKDKGGEWVDDAHWNEITIFSDQIQKYIEKHLDKGDLVHARGRIRQASFEKNGERIYTVNLICTEFARLAKADGNQDTTRNQAAGRATHDEDIPF
jgi:single-strand DNA-binding protein